MICSSRLRKILIWSEKKLYMYLKFTNHIKDLKHFLFCVCFCQRCVRLMKIQFDSMLGIYVLLFSIKFNVFAISQ